MKALPESSLLMLADRRELVPREKPEPDTVALSAVWGGKVPQIASAVWGGKRSGHSKPRIWTSATSSTSSTLWRTSTTDQRK